MLKKSDRSPVQTQNENEREGVMEEAEDLDEKISIACFEKQGPRNGRHTPRGTPREHGPSRNLDTEAFGGQEKRILENERFSG